MAKKDYHKPPEDPRTIGGGLEEKGREGIVLFAEYTMMVIFFEDWRRVKWEVLVRGAAACPAGTWSTRCAPPTPRRRRPGSHRRLSGPGSRRYQPGEWTTWSIAIEKARATSRLRPLVGEK
jgi:hypothetical protein